MGAEVDLPRCARRGFRGNCRPWAVRITSAFRRAPRVPFRTDEKEPKVRLRTLRRVLRNLREYLASTRRLPSLPTGTPAEGSIQVAGAPNDRSRMARQNPRRKTTPVPGVRALCARARRSRAVFRLPVGAARHAKTAVPPREHPRYGSGYSLTEALRPRRGGGRDAVSPFADPWTGRRRLWPKANRRRRWGSRGRSPLRLLSPISCPYKKWGRPPGRDPAVPPLPERQI